MFLLLLPLIELRDLGTSVWTIVGKCKKQKTLCLFVDCASLTPLTLVFTLSCPACILFVEIFSESREQRC